MIMDGKGRPKKDWSQWKCKNCGTPKKENYKDYCSPCYRRLIFKKRYHEDPVFREKILEKAKISSKKRYGKRMAEDPTWNAQQQKKFRTNHPATFNYTMCRFYYRRMSLEAREKLAKEVKEEERCVMCGDTGMFKIGSGQTATLNGKDCTELIEAHYKKGQWLCGDCLFK
jgi:hypothetical protein